MIKPQLIKIFIASIFLWSQIFLPLIEVRAQAVDCTKRLDEAQQNYYNGNFETSIELVKRCLQNDSITETERIRAYKILAQTYLAKDYVEPAKKVIIKILEVNPNYTPAIEQEPPQFVELVFQVKSELKTEKGDTSKSTSRKSNTWLWVAAGSAAVVAGVAVILLSMKQEEEKQTLPNPPPWPNE
jgi:hypothetical protein